jgi:hypothetical protein
LYTAGAARIGAQVAPRTTFTLDAAGARIEQPFRRPTRGGAYGLSAQHERERTSLLGQLAATWMPDNVGAWQANLLAGVAPIRRLPGLRTEAGYTRSSYGLAERAIDPRRESGASRGRNDGALLRQGFAFTHVGLWAGAGRTWTARTVDRRDERFRATALDAGLWTAWGPLYALGTVQRAWATDYALVEASSFFLKRHASAYDLLDRTVTAGARAWRVDVSGTWAWRFGVDATRGRSAVRHGTATLALTDAIAVQGTHGTMLADLLRGVPGATLTTVGLRVRLGRRGTAVRTRTIDTTFADGAEARVARDSTGGTLYLRITAPEGATVEVASSAYEWEPTEIPCTDGVCHARLVLPSGAHRVAVRVNRGAWRAPKGLTAFRDDLGGEAGIVVVP